MLNSASRSFRGVVFLLALGVLGSPDRIARAEQTTLRATRDAFIGAEKKSSRLKQLPAALSPEVAGRGVDDGEDVVKRPVALSRATHHTPVPDVAATASFPASRAGSPLRMLHRTTRPSRPSSARFSSRRFGEPICPLSALSQVEGHRSALDETNQHCPPKGGAF